MEPRIQMSLGRKLLALGTVTVVGLAGIPAGAGGLAPPDAPSEAPPALPAASAACAFPELPHPLRPLCGRAGPGRASVAPAAAPGCTVVPGVNDRCPAWVSTYDHPDGHGGTGPYSGVGLDVVTSLAASPAGDRVFATGGSYGGSVSGLDYATAAFDVATGARVWAARHDGPLEYDQDAPFGPDALAVSPDGSRVFVTGILDLGSPGVRGEADYGTVAYDAATGRRAWAAAYNGPVDGFDIPYAIEASPDGSRVYVTGQSDTSVNVYEFGDDRFEVPNPDYATIAYDAATGEQLWVATYDDVIKNVDAATAIAVSPDGRRVYVTGRSTCKNTLDAVTVAYDAGIDDPETGGRQLWEACYDGGQGGYYGDFTTAAVATPDGSRLLVTGITTAALSEDYRYLTVAYEAATGSRSWASTYTGPQKGFSGAVAVALGPGGGRAYVTGVSNGLPTYPLYYDTTGKRRQIDLDVATVAYDVATGQQAWAARYAAPGQAFEAGTGVGVSADGAGVYVTGYSGLDVRQLPNDAGVRPDVKESSFATMALDAATGATRWVARHNSSAAGLDLDSYPFLGLAGSRVVAGGTFTYAVEDGEDNLYDYGIVAYEG